MLSLFLVELMNSELWGMLASLVSLYRTSVLSNSDCKLGFKALEALFSCGLTIISKDHQMHILLMLWESILI